MLRVLQHQVSASVWPEAEARAEFRSQLKRRRGLSGLGWKFGNFKASHRGPCAVNFLGKKTGMIWSQAKSLLYGDAKAIQQKREMLLRQGSEATESPRVFWWYFDVFGCLIIWWILMCFFRNFQYPSFSFLPLAFDVCDEGIAVVASLPNGWCVCCRWGEVAELFAKTRAGGEIESPQSCSTDRLIIFLSRLM